MDFGTTFIEKLGESHIYQPLTHLGSVILASNRVPPVKEAGAKWCISMQKIDEFWSTYTNKDIKFLFVFTPYTKYALTIYPKFSYLENEVYAFEDKNIGWPSWCNLPEIKTCIENLREVSKPALDELLKKYKNFLTKNPDGTIDKIISTPLRLNEFINNGQFICQFNNWIGNFYCENKNLTSLEGAPKRIIKGDFNCNSNHLTSLKGSPKEVEGNFYCNNNQLTSLEGVP